MKALEPLTLEQLLQKRCWIFDLDGTLTEPLHDFARMRSQLGVPDGVGILEYIEQQPTLERDRLNYQLDKIEHEVALQARPMAGAQQLVEQLYQQGCQLGILTRNRRACVDIVLERLELERFFDPAAIIASECAVPKPSPVGIEQLLHRWRADQAETVMVGDYLYDLQAGRAAGVATVHFNPQRRENWPELTDLELSGFSVLLRV